MSEIEKKRFLVYSLSTASFGNKPIYCASRTATEHIKKIDTLY